MTSQTSPSLMRVERLPDVAPALHVLEGALARDVQWWIEDHFQFGFQADGMTLVPATRIGRMDDLDIATVRDLLTALGALPRQRLTLWWALSGGMASLPVELIAAHLLQIWLPSEDILICAPPEDWALFLYHEGQFSVGHMDPSYVARASADDCRQSGQWPSPDDTLPDTERQQALQAILTANRAAGRPPCSGVAIRTYGELHWLMAAEVRSRPRSGVGADPPVSRRPDLRQVIIRNINLDGMNFKGARLAEADLRGTNLTDARLQFTDMQGADLTEAILYRAHCLRANLVRASLRSACLNRAYLRRAYLMDADFTGAQLVATQVSANAVAQIAATATATTRLWVWTEQEN